MITKLQSVDPERLGKEQRSGDYARIFLGRGSRIDFKGGLGSGGDGSWRYQVVRGLESRERMWG